MQLCFKTDVKVIVIIVKFSFDRWWKRCFLSIVQWKPIITRIHKTRNTLCWILIISSHRILKCLFCTDLIVTDEKAGFYNRLNSYTIKLCSHGWYIWQIFVTFGYLPCLFPTDCQEMWNQSKEFSLFVYLSFQGLFLIRRQVICV